MFLRIALCCLLISGWVAAAPLDWTPELRAAESENIASWKAPLSEAKQAEGMGKLRLLAPGLRMMGDWEWDDRNPEVDSLFQETRKTMIGVPGYASLIAGDIEKTRAEVHGGSDLQLAALQDSAVTAFTTLKFLRSPESVAAVAGYLSDETKMPSVSTPGDETPPLARGAYWTLYAMRIRGYPMAKNEDRYVFNSSGERIPADRFLRNAKAWWREVEAGRRPISFPGEEIQYHFNPDGTVRTSPYNPADYPPVVARMTLAEIVALPYLPWIGGGVGVVVLLFGWWKFRRGTSP
jgi:hypothetical protein